MKKNNFYALTSLFILIISSCLNYEQITTIKTDNSGEMFIHYYTNLNNWQDTLVLSKLGIFNSDSLLKQFTSEYSVIERIEVFEDFSDSTIHSQIELTFNNFDSLKHTETFRNAEFSIKDGSDDTKIFSQFIPPFVTGFGFDLKDYTISYTYYLPGKILNHNAVEKSNNKLVWKFSLDEIGKGKTINAVYHPFRLKETPSWIYYLALTVILIVIIFLFKKKRA